MAPSGVCPATTCWLRCATWPLPAPTVARSWTGHCCGSASRSPTCRHALGVLGLPARDVVHVGDRPAKDVAGATAAGMRCVRVTTGEYAHLPDVPGTWRTVGGFAEAAGLLLAAVAV